MGDFIQATYLSNDYNGLLSIDRRVISNNREEREERKTTNRTTDRNSATNRTYGKSKSCVSRIHRSSIRANKRNKTNKMPLFYVLAVLFISVTIFITLSCNVKANDDTVYYKYFISYTVEKGDTLWSIAQEYRCNESVSDYIDEVQSINHFYSSQITEGQFLIIPYYDTVYYE